MKKRTETATVAQTPVTVNMKPLTNSANADAGSYMPHSAAFLRGDEEKHARQAVQNERQQK